MNASAKLLTHSDFLDHRNLDEIRRVHPRVITALSSLGRQINAEIVAEGIEQPEEVESLMRLGVAYGQGYLLGRPSARLAPAAN